MQVCCCLLLPDPRSRVLVTAGSANTSATEARAQLSATFEEPSDCADASTGFTYELREGLEGRYVLGDFLGGEAGGARVSGG